jgi:hypothetical protein
MAVTCQPDYEVSDSIIHIIVEVLGVCFWPFSEAQLARTSVSFGGNRRSNLMNQRRFTTQLRHSGLKFQRPFCAQSGRFGFNKNS